MCSFLSRFYFLEDRRPAIFETELFFPSKMTFEAFLSFNHKTFSNAGIEGPVFLHLLNRLLKKESKGKVGSKENRSGEREQFTEFVVGLKKKKKKPARRETKSRERTVFLPPFLFFVLVSARITLLILKRRKKLPTSFVYLCFELVATTNDDDDDNDKQR